MLIVNARKAVTDALVLDHFFCGVSRCRGFLLLHGVLNLEEELNTLDGGDDGLGDGGGDTSDEEVGCETALGGFFFGLAYNFYYCL